MRKPHYIGPQLRFPCDNYETHAMSQRFLAAMLCYLGLGVLAVFTLEYMPRTMVLLILGALAVKTWIATKRAP